MVRAYNRLLKNLSPFGASGASLGLRGGDVGGMCGSDRPSGKLFSYLHIEAQICTSRPLSAITAIVDEAMEALGADFDALYVAGSGQRSTPPQMLLIEMLLQAFYSIRS